MKLINIKSKKGIINLFADFILNNFDKSKNTILQVTDFNHFFIVNGITNSDTVLDISKIKDDFISKYQNLFEESGYEKNLSIMDLIKYNQEISEESSVECSFYDSFRNLYHSSVLNYEFNNNNIYSIDYKKEPVIEVNRDLNLFMYGVQKSAIQITSEFPYGYSLSMGRTLLYYSEYISYNIFSNNLCTKLDIVLSKNKTNDDEQEIIVKSDGLYSDENIKSIILDNFDFDFLSFNDNLKVYDFCDDIKKPTSDKPWLVKNINPNDLTII